MNSDPAGIPDLDQRVVRIVAEALGIDAARITPAARLIADLGADSLDFLDIVFKLETEFGIQVTRGELEREARGDMSDDEFAPDGVVSAAGLQRLRELMPEVADRIAPGLHQGQILGLFTVQTFAHLVERKQAQAAAS